jgi:hypothetical protein
MSDESCLDRIDGQVARGGRELLVASDFARVRMRAEEVGAAAMATVVATRVLAVEALKCTREAGVRDSQQGVVVSPKENVREERKLEALAGQGEPLEEVLAVAVVQEEMPCVAAVGGQVIDACCQSARRAGHSVRLGSRLEAKDRGDRN